MNKRLELTDKQKEYFATRFYFHSKEQKEDNVFNAIKAGGINRGILITLEKLGYNTRFLYEVEESE